ncbi:MAG: hypothetical protein BRC30_02495 [Nanohaloarchaea archaeon SW_7_46_7]|nr:MAG: hypothetical protein BRC30_02495 [Nanohaloarchaea archaeon SW_7_46_7]
MNLRDKVIQGFVATYIENEQAIVRNLLQTGRIDREEWQELSEQFQELAEKHAEEEITSQEYIKQRRELRKKFDKYREEKQAGLTRDEADKNYNQIKKNQEETLKKAFKNSSHSTLRIAGKIVSARIKFMIARLKTI